MVANTSNFESVDQEGREGDCGCEDAPLSEKAGSESLFSWKENVPSTKSAGDSANGPEVEVAREDSTCSLAITVASKSLACG